MYKEIRIGADIAPIFLLNDYYKVGNEVNRREGE
jgi:hypothetical protein